MRNVFIFFAFLIAGMAHAQIITNVDKLRIRDVEQGLESDKILVIDSDNVVRWTDAIEVDLSEYYTITEVDAFVADLEAGLLERYTKHEVDDLLDGLELRLDDYYTKTKVDSIITNINDRIDNIDLNTVTSVDNVTSIKIRGSDIFTNNLETDFAQIADVNKAGFGLISMQSEMKIGLVAKDGTTLLDDVDLSWLASGDLAVTIDDTDPNNPELVFSQGGVEVARIPASTLLSGVARSANLSNYILQFKDGSGAVVYSVNLEPLFEDYFTKAEANARYALNTRTITAGTGLTGGGSLTDNRTIALSTATQDDIAKGVEAHGWGNHSGLYFGALGSNVQDLDNVPRGTAMKAADAVSQNAGFKTYGSGFTMGYNNTYKSQIWLTRLGDVQYRFTNSNGEWLNPVTTWHSGNFDPSNYYTKNESNNIFEPIFSKNSAFNKNFGTTAGTVAQGNHTHNYSDLIGAPTIPTVNNGTLTLSTGTGLSGSATFGANQDTASTFSVTVANTHKLPTVAEWNALPTTQNISDNYVTKGAYANSVLYGNVIDLNAPPLGTYMAYTRSTSSNKPINGGGFLKNIYFASLGVDYNSQDWASLDSNRFFKRSNTSLDFVELYHSGNLEDPATESWVNDQGFIKDLSNYYTKNESNDRFVTKTENNIFSGNNTFTNPVKVPMGVNPDEAINLAQLTASNPIALNKIVNSKSFTVPSSVSSFALDMEGGRTFIVPSGLLDVDGAVVKVTFTVSGLAPLDSSNKYRSLISTTNTGFVPGNFGYSVGPNNAVANVEFTIRRQSASNILVDTYIDEKHFPSSGTSAMEAVVHNYLGYNQGDKYIGSYTNFGIDVYVRPNGLGNNQVKVSDILIQKIK